METAVERAEAVKVKEVRDKAEKEAAEKETEARNKELAKGPLFGGQVDVKTVEASDVLQEQYIEGYSPILIKCTRGEQKCELGDKVYQITVTDPITLEDEDYIFIIPGPVIQFLIDASSPVDGMSVLEFSEYQTKRAKRLAKLVSPPKASQLPAQTHTTASQTTATTRK